MSEPTESELTLMRLQAHVQMRRSSGWSNKKIADELEIEVEQLLAGEKIIASLNLPPSICIEAKIE